LKNAAMRDRVEGKNCGEGGGGGGYGIMTQYYKPLEAGILLFLSLSPFQL